MLLAIALVGANAVACKNAATNRDLPSGTDAGDAAPGPANDGGDAATAAAPSQYVHRAVWSRDDTLVMATADAIYVLAPAAQKPTLRARVPSGIRFITAARNADAIAVVAAGGRVFALPPGASEPAPVPGDAANTVAISDDGALLAVERGSGTAAQTAFFDLPSLRARGRVAASVDLFQPTGALAFSQNAVFATEGGAVLQAIEGGGGVFRASALGSRIAFFTAPELVVFDTEKRATVRVPIACKFAPADGYDERGKRAIRWCHDRATVIDVATLARVEVKIPSPPPRNDGDGFPWFAQEEVRFIGGKIVLAGIGYDRDRFVSINPEAKTATVLKVTEPPTDESRPYASNDGSRYFEIRRGEIVVKDRDDKEKLIFGDGSQPPPWLPKKPPPRPRPAK